MESTGVYWRPGYAILEGSFELLLVNAQHVKRVPRDARPTSRTGRGWRSSSSTACCARALSRRHRSASSASSPATASG
jgi:hypothetical protein